MHIFSIVVILGLIICAGVMCYIKPESALAGVLLGGAVAALASWCATIWQNKNSLFCLGVDSLLKLEERFISAEMREKRYRAASNLVIYDKYPLETDSEYIDEVLDFFSMLGILVKKNAIDLQLVWHTFSYYLIRYYKAAESYIEKQQDDDETSFESLTELYEAIYRIEKKRNPRIDGDLTKEKLQQFLEIEAKGY